MQDTRAGRRDVAIRELDVEVWVKLRGEALRRRWTTSAMLEHIVREWFAAQHNGATDGAPAG